MNSTFSQMLKPKQKRSKRSKYDSIGNVKRRRLLEMVTEEGVQIKIAAERLGLNYSTAKTILQLYRRSGRIEKIERK